MDTKINKINRATDIELKSWSKQTKADKLINILKKDESVTFKDNKISKTDLVLATLEHLMKNTDDNLLTAFDNYVTTLDEYGIKDLSVLNTLRSALIESKSLTSREYESQAFNIDNLEQPSTEELQIITDLHGKIAEYTSHTKDNSSLHKIEQHIKSLENSQTHQAPQKQHESTLSKFASKFGILSSNAKLHQSATKLLDSWSSNSIQHAGKAAITLFPATKKEVLSELKLMTKTFDTAKLKKLEEIMFSAELSTTELILSTEDDDATIKEKMAYNDQRLIAKFTGLGGNYEEYQKLKAGQATKDFTDMLVASSLPIDYKFENLKQLATAVLMQAEQDLKS